MTGRPTKLTPETHAAIVKDIAMGVTYADAAGAAGVDYTTFAGWMRRGQEEAKGAYFNFFNAVREARAQALKKFTLTISRAAADGDWRAALEYLKRHDPETWGDRQQVDANITGSMTLTWFDGSEVK